MLRTKESNIEKTGQHGKGRVLRGKASGFEVRVSRSLVGC